VSLADYAIHYTSYQLAHMAFDFGAVWLCTGKGVILPDECPATYLYIALMRPAWVSYCTSGPAIQDEQMPNLPEKQWMGFFLHLQAHRHTDSQRQSAASQKSNHRSSAVSLPSAKLFAKLSVMLFAKLYQAACCLPSCLPFPKLSAALLVLCQALYQAACCLPRCLPTCFRQPAFDLPNCLPDDLSGCLPLPSSLPTP
jgi:hypothetical protein